MPGFDEDGFERLDGVVPVDGVLDGLQALAADRRARRLAGAGLHTAGSGLQRLVLPRPVPEVLALADGLAAAAVAFAGEPALVWGAELLTKPPGGAGGPVGWHQDRPYFHWWQGPTATAWIALSDMVPGCGAVRYVVGSHRWADGYDTADFDRSPASSRREPPVGERWVEVEVLGPVGTVVVHHPGTVHGSGPNGTDQVRHALALRLRTVRTTLRADTPASVRRVLESAWP